MKISLALGPRRHLSRQTAWGCLTANLAVPGSGSLLAGRVSGYPQLALGIGGTGLSLLLGVRFVVWNFANWSRLHDPLADPLATFKETLVALRWPLLGLGLFAVGWLWALATSLAILRAAREAGQSGVPPRLG